MNNFSQIKKHIERGGEISPFLFLGENLDYLHSELEKLCSELIHTHELDRQSVYHLYDEGTSMKIAEVRNFLEDTSMTARHKFQIFFIENFPRMTVQGQNACLKFFEEPGEGNIVFLTARSEAGILETILSRVQIIQSVTHGDTSKIAVGENSFYRSMIESHVSGSSDELVRYFFSGKYEKQEYIEFLQSLIYFILEKQIFLHLLDNLESDIQGIEKNNFQGRYIVDRYIMSLKLSL